MLITANGQNGPEKPHPQNESTSRGISPRDPALEEVPECHLRGGNAQHQQEENNDDRIDHTRDHTVNKTRSPQEQDPPIGENDLDYPIRI